jgi:ribosomal protein S18 acetylase RimI-like enzyme
MGRPMLHLDGETEPTMSHLMIRSYCSEDEESVIQLWRACGLVVPQNNPRRDIARKTQVNPELFLVGTLDGRLVATCMAGYEGHRGWLNYLAVAPHWQRQGIGSQIVAEAERRLRALGCPKINLQVRSSNQAVISFYQSLGYTVDNVISLGKRMVVDDPGVAR